MRDLPIILAFRSGAARYQPYFTLTAANVGYGYWSHDIEQPAADYELGTRWVQWAAVSPVRACVILMCCGSLRCDIYGACVRACRVVSCCGVAVV